MTRVLVVDDHAAVRRAVGEVLAEGFAGAVVAEAATGEEAARLVAGAEWDLVLLDLALGGRGGLETMREIGRLRPGLPVVVMSMHPEAQYGPAARAAGAAGYVPKGSAPAVILGAARAALASGAGLGATAPGSAAVFPTPWISADLEEERRRLAGCLHDEVGQGLAAAQISLGLAAAAADPAEIHGHAAAARTLVAEAIDSLRRVVSRMRPPLLDELGLVPALRALLAGLGAERGGDAPALEAPPDLPRAAPEQEMAAFRVVERAAATVLRHVPPDRGRVVLEQDGEGAGRLRIAVSGGDTTLRMELPYPPRGER